jgi:hypothetical protein
MNAWSWVLMAVVTLIWIGIFAAVAYLASSRLAARRVDP